MYDPKDWYWIVGGNGPHLENPGDEFPAPQEVYSSAAGKIVSVGSPDYHAWLAAHSDMGVNPTTRIDTAENLAEVLTLAGLTYNANG